jgi:hypothetical protein
MYNGYSPEIWRLWIYSAEYIDLIGNGVDWGENGGLRGLKKKKKSEKMGEIEVMGDNRKNIKVKYMIRNGFQFFKGGKGKWRRINFVFEGVFLNKNFGKKVVV